eukprot:4978146-Pyramimonas_sp.AAC.1
MSLPPPPPRPSPAAPTRRMYKAAGGKRNRGDMRGHADTRLRNTTVGMFRKSCCCEMGWRGYAKRKEFRN